MSDQTTPGTEPSVTEPQPATTVDQGTPTPVDPLEARVSSLETAIGNLSSSLSSLSSTLGSLNNTTVPSLASRVSTLESAATSAAPSPAPAPSADTPAPAGDGTPATPVVPDDPAAAIVARVESGDRGPVIHELGQMLGKAGYPNTVSRGQGDVYDQSVADALTAFLTANTLTLPLESLVTSEAWQALEQAAAAVDATNAAAPTPTTEARPDAAPQQEATP